MRDYHSTNNTLEELDIVQFNRNYDGLLKDCMLIRGGLRKAFTKKGKRVCDPSECPLCGWNPREAKRRMSKPIHEHENGLWGF